MGNWTFQSSLLQIIQRVRICHDTKQPAQSACTRSFSGPHAATAKGYVYVWAPVTASRGASLPHSSAHLRPPSPRRWVIGCLMWSVFVILGVLVASYPLHALRPVEVLFIVDTYALGDSEVL